MTKSDRPISGPLLHVTLAEHLERLRQEPSWRAKGHNAITLTKGSGLRLVLMLFGPGAKLAEHRTAGPLTFHVLTGAVMFRSGERAETLRSGELVALDAAIAHEVEALEESACLLTLGGS
jgi:quercetin dioxygenase-like cupin family protein